MPDLVKYFDSKKFMWDGDEYEDRAAAEAAAEKYRADLFEVRLVEEEGKSYVYSRRVAAETATSG